MQRPERSAMKLCETSYELGRKRAYLSLLGESLRALGVDNPEAKQAAWVSERQEAIITLRSLCLDFGDNDWPDSLHLSDIIERHLMRHIVA